MLAFSSAIHLKANCRKKDKKKLLDADNCGSLRYIPMKKGARAVALETVLNCEVSAMD